MGEAMKIQSIMGYVMIAIAFVLTGAIILEFSQIAQPYIGFLLILPVVLSVALISQVIVFLFYGNISKPFLAVMLLLIVILSFLVTAIDISWKSSAYLVLLGLTLIVLMSVIPQFLSLYYSNQSAMISFIAAAALTLLLALTQNRFAIFILSLILLMTACFLMVDDELFDLPRDSSKQESFVRSHLKDVASTFVLGILAGSVEILLASFDIQMVLGSFVPVCLGMAVCFLYFYRHDEVRTILRRWLFIFCMVTLLLIMVLPLEGKLACSFLILFFLGVFFGEKVYLTFFSFEFSRRNFFIISATTFLGMLIGSTLAYAVFQTDNNSLFGNTIIIYLFQLITLFLFVEYFILGVPQSSEISTKDEEHLLKDSSEVSEDSTGEGKEGFLRSRCKTLSQEYKLSVRQQEVLLMLAKGRNAQYISDTLQVSRSTAKTHIYNIYQKFGVGSQQEIISIVEERQL
jgi:DNA-binding CsgD family transcriptional regulator